MRRGCNFKSLTGEMDKVIFQAKFAQEDTFFDWTSRGSCSTNSVLPTDAKRGTIFDDAKCLFKYCQSNAIICNDD